MLKHHRSTLMLGTAIGTYKTPLAIARCFHDLDQLSRWCGAVVKKLNTMKGT